MRWWCLCFVAACSGTMATPDAPSHQIPANLARGISETKLAFDVTSFAATASITFEASDMAGASLEVGDLAIDSVKVAGADVPFAVTKAQLDIGIAASGAPVTVDIAYRAKLHEGFEGLSVDGFTFVWPYFCGNLFPCHSNPADGTTFTLALGGVPAGKTAVFPPAIATEAPSYQIAWSVDAYTELPLGTTTAGTQVSIWHHPGEAADAQAGTAHLVAAFDWFEKTIGPYRFGNQVGSVSVRWPGGAFGGMEHHPRWHTPSAGLATEETHVHEAAHGWFGDGVRIACWEDFVLSEGTVSYLAGRALEVVAPTVGAAVWAHYTQALAGVSAQSIVWPQSCGRIDVIKDRLYTNAPYMRGAFFYRALADKLGAAKVDQILAAFYAAHAGKAATMHDMLATIQSVGGYDATTCANMWLSSTTIPSPGACP